MLNAELNSQNSDARPVLLIDGRSLKRFDKRLATAPKDEALYRKRLSVMAIK